MSGIVFCDSLYSLRWSDIAGISIKWFQSGLRCVGPQTSEFVTGKGFRF